MIINACILDNHIGLSRSGTTAQLRRPQPEAQGSLPPDKAWETS
jgi:hypothetical protein